MSATPIVNASPVKDIKFKINALAYFNDVNVLNEYMTRAENLSEAGIHKGKVRLVSLLFFTQFIQGVVKLLGLLEGKASSNIHFEAVAGSFNITIAYQTYMYFRYCR